VEADNRVLVDANPRTWIGKGFGLPLSISLTRSLLSTLSDTRDISPISIETTFSDMFYQLLQQICDGMDIQPLDPRYINFSDTFYVTSHNRFEFLKSILTKFPFLLKGILGLFPEFCNFFLQYLKIYLQNSEVSLPLPC
jgi:hypothetical protein